MCVIAFGANFRFNGHPHYAELSPDLNCEQAVLIGNGNVAIDVARILLKAPPALQDTDIAEHALDALSEPSLPVQLSSRAVYRSSVSFQAEMMARFCAVTLQRCCRVESGSAGACSRAARRGASSMDNSRVA